MRDFYTHVLVPRVHPESEVRYVVFRGLDGYWTRLQLDDALAPDVLIADRLDGEELSLEHGAPIRVVAPAYYGYKSLKHLSAIELWREFDGVGPGGWLMHPRGRVALEERGQVLPGWAFRWLERTLMPVTLWYSRRTARNR